MLRAALVVFLLSATAANAAGTFASGLIGPPVASLKYRPVLAREATAVWGLSACISCLAGQLNQESGWNAAAHSSFADGLAQFTVKTAKAYGAKTIDDLLDPNWAIHAQVKYMHDLYNGQTHFNNDCDRIEFAFSDYNGGPGWRMKRQRRSPKPGSFLVTGRINPGITAANQKQNYDYPIRIMYHWKPLYDLWGSTITCK
jgi:hypothetical protein